MRTTVTMPKLGLEVDEGVVSVLHVEVGAAVARDDVLLVLSTDKVEGDVVAPHAGTVVALHVAAGDTVVIGEALLDLDDGAAA